MTEKQICRRLGVTPAGLKVLVKAMANDGEAGGASFGHGAAGARSKLLRDGLIGPCLRIYETSLRSRSWRYKTWEVTPEGRAKVEAARLLGW